MGAESQSTGCKQFRNACRKVINVLLEAIPTASIHHRLQNYNNLINLLSGNQVDIAEIQIRASMYPKGVSFCINVFSKQLLAENESIISNDTETVFCYAAVIVALWQQNKEFGRLLLIHFYRDCPYLIPFYWNRAIDQNILKFSRSQGCQNTDAMMENQSAFLKHKTEIMRLYAAIIITKPTQDQRKNSPGLAQGWRWLAAFLNLEPKPDITAAMLHSFLEIAGSTLQTAYGRMFKKMMTFICLSYFPAIQRIDSGVTVIRLQWLLYKFCKRGHFQVPHGSQTAERYFSLSHQRSRMTRISTTSGVWHETIVSMIKRRNSSSNENVQWLKSKQATQNSPVISEYFELQEFFDNFLKEHHEFLYSDLYKPHRHRCVNMVNFIIDYKFINQPMDIQEVCKLLENFLQGKLVRINILIPPFQMHQTFLEFCMSLVAEKFILMNLTAIDNCTTVVCHAKVLMALCNNIPGFKKFLLVNFYKHCPYLIPYSAQHYKNQIPFYTNYKNRKNNYDINEMKGIIRLFAEMLVLLPSIGECKRPFGLAHGWCWLASVLNNQPTSDITAEILLTFLEITCTKLQATYKKVFNKMLTFIRQKYTGLFYTVGSKQSVCKLTTFLDIYITGSVN